DHADVADVVPAELDVHQTGHALGGVGVLVVLESLDQGRGAVAKAHDRDPNLVHVVCSFLRSVADARRRCPTGAVMPDRFRSCWIRPVSHAMSASVAARPCSISARWYSSSVSASPAIVSLIASRRSSSAARLRSRSRTRVSGGRYRKK